MKTKQRVCKYDLITNDLLIRKCDKSFIEHHGLTVPKNLYKYFNVQYMELGARKNIVFEYKGKCYQAHFVREKIDLARIRLFWETSLKIEFKKIADKCIALPSVKFEKVTEEYYKLEMIDYVLVEDVIDEIQHEQNQNYDVTYNKVKDYTDEEIQTLYIERKQSKPKLRKASSKRYATDPRLKATRNKLSNYQCEIDKNHKTFVSMSNENDYVECHHLIPMMAQEEFLSNKDGSQSIYLDSLFNLISLCPICHTQFHYGSNEEVEKIFWKAFELRKEELLAEGFTKEKMEYILNKYYRNEFK